MAYRLGKNRPVIDDRTMCFATYVKPALPAGFDLTALEGDLKQITG